MYVHDLCSAKVFEESGCVDEDVPRQGGQLKDGRLTENNIVL